MFQEALAVQVVTCEPVSASRFPDIREGTGNFEAVGRYPGVRIVEYMFVFSRLRENSPTH